jgi:hypothetical protein
MIKKIWIYILIGLLIEGLILFLLFFIIDRFFYDIQKTFLGIIALLIFMVLTGFWFYFVLYKIKQIKTDFLNYFKSLGICMVMYVFSPFIYTLLYSIIKFHHHGTPVKDSFAPFIFHIIVGLITSSIVSIFFRRANVAK